MFTGLIREIGTIQSFNNHQLRITCDYKPHIGDSIALNGICLSATVLHSDGFSVDVSEETLSCMAKERFARAERVHLEPAMQLSDRLEGHIVQGHIDGVGEIKAVVKNAHSYDVFVAIDEAFAHFIVPKGSVSIDGISLTINEVLEQSFRLTIIPITYESTLFKHYKTGTKVNIEYDMFAKYIYHMTHKSTSKRSVTWDDIDKIQAQY